MPVEPVFFDLNFSESMGPATVKVARIVRDCEGNLYHLPKMKQVRAAHSAPIGRHKAKGVFLIIEKRLDCIAISPPERLCKGTKKSEVAITICASFNDWASLEGSVREWSQRAKNNKRPPSYQENGDGIALPGGLPMTNRSKF